MLHINKGTKADSSNRLWKKLITNYFYGKKQSLSYCLFLYSHKCMGTIQLLRGELIILYIIHALCLFSVCLFTCCFFSQLNASSSTISLIINHNLRTRKQNLKTMEMSSLLPLLFNSVKRVGNSSLKLGLLLPIDFTNYIF